MASHDKCGIYSIVCCPTGKSYVGSSKAIYQRWRQHRKLLAIDRHTSRYLQAAWKKYGADAFELLVIEECAPDALESREQVFIDLLKPAFNSIIDVRRRCGPEMLANRAAALRARAAKITHCPKGHEYTEANTGRNAKGKRYCRECNRLRVQGVYANESQEQREARRQRAAEYAQRTKAQRAVQARDYAAANREKLKAYYASRAELSNRRRKDRRASFTPEERARYLQQKREWYARSLLKRE
jgi:group I intron endonuclease